MPAYYFECPECRASDRRILSAKAAKDYAQPCEECGRIMKRVPKPPSTQITETLDNGLMPRRLERPADAEQIYHDRAHGKKGVI